MKYKMKYNILKSLKVFFFYLYNEANLSLLLKFSLKKNVHRLKPNLHFVHWNEEGWKTGLCSVAPVGQPYSLLTLANNTCVHNTFSSVRDRFVKLYRRKVSYHNKQETVNHKAYSTLSKINVTFTKFDI